MDTVYKIGKRGQSRRYERGTRNELRDVKESEIPRAKDEGDG